MRFLHAIAPVAIALGACNESSSGPLASSSIDALGGSVAITSGTYAGTSMVIAANTVTTATTFAIRSDTRTVEAGVVAVGPAARFTPDDATLATPATITLPFTASSLPPGVSAADLRVSSRTRSRTFSRLTPTAADLATGIVTVSVTDLATLWVVAPDAFESTRFFPLDDGNVYEFDSAANNNLRVVDATNDPGLPGAADVRLTLTLPWFHRSAIYLDKVAGVGIDVVGLIDAPPQQLATLEWLGTGVPFLDDVETVGESHTAAYSYAIFSVDLAMLPPTQIGTGSGMLTVDIVERATVDTAVGRFRNTVKVTWTDIYVDSLGGSGSSSFSLWLARDVGPVQIQSGADQPIPIRNATVAGRPVRGS